MSVCGQSGQTEEDSASEEVGAVVRDKASDTYKQKPVSKVVRVLTVLAYLLSVSLAAILLSVYYICVWKSPELPPDEPALSARTGNASEYSQLQYADQLHHATGGGDTTVNPSIIHPTSENVTSAVTDVDVSNSTSDTSLETTGLPDTTPQGLYNGTSDDIGTFNNTDT